MQLRQIPHNAVVQGVGCTSDSESLTLVMHGVQVTVTERRNANGTTTWFISNLVHWFTTHLDEVEEMLLTFSTNRNWEQVKG